MGATRDTMSLEHTPIPEALIIANPLAYCAQINDEQEAIPRWLNKAAWK